MDRYSHIAFADALLSVAGERRDMAYLSTLPMIDASPSFLHRLHCHPLVKAPVIADAARHVFGTLGAPPALGDSFERRRLEQDREVFSALFEETRKDPVATMALDDGFGALLSIASHSYFDTWNNPVQAFPPLGLECSGRYELWSRLDFFGFRIVWYERAADKLRAQVLAEAMWAASFPAAVLLRAMVSRIADVSAPRVSVDAVAHVERVLGVDDVPLDADACAFLLTLEHSIDTHLLAIAEDAGVALPSHAAV